MKHPPKPLEQLVSAVFLKFGSNQQEADLIAQHLVEAKNLLAHGEWGKLTGRAEGETGLLPFSYQTAHKLMSVAEDPRIVAHGRHLPASWRTTYELTRLSDEEWQKGLETGVICPEMERKDVAALRAGKPFVTQWSGNNEWYTPVQYIEAARTVLGAIDLDPASCEYAQKTVKAATWYGEEDDGLEYAWKGRIWLNPPYQTPAPFIAKLIEAVGLGARAILLTNNNTDTQWWHDAATACAAICFTRGRISFYNVAGESSAPTNGQTFFYFGDQDELFADTFGAFGSILGRLE